jgi:hypothetical protein
MKSAQKHLKSVQVVKTDLDMVKLPIASGAHMALNKPVPQNPSEAPDIQKLIQSSFQYISCSENRYILVASSETRTLSSIPQPIIDRNGLIIAHIASAFGDATYYEDAHDLFKIIVEE